MWRGPPLAEFEFASAVFERERLDELHAVALEGMVQSRLACGEHREVIGTITGLVASNPEALAVYRDTCEALDEIGLQPGRGLRHLEQAILQHDEALSTNGGVGDTSTGQDEMLAVPQTRDATPLTSLRLASVVCVDLAGFATMSEPLEADDEAER